MPAKLSTPNKDHNNNFPKIMIQRTSNKQCFKTVVARYFIASIAAIQAICNYIII